jgi:hypothetical protein
MTTRWFAVHVRRGTHKMLATEHISQGTKPRSPILTMFWYLSFLRPPPSAVVISSPGITITPQIANDLRTE